MEVVNVAEILVSRIQTNQIWTDETALEKYHQIWICPTFQVVHKS